MKFGWKSFLNGQASIASASEEPSIDKDSPRIDHLTEKFFRRYLPNSFIGYQSVSASILWASPAAVTMHLSILALSFLRASGILKDLFADEDNFTSLSINLFESSMTKSISS